MGNTWVKTRPAPLVALIAAAALVLTGCTDDEDDAVAGLSGSGGAATSESADSETADAEAEEPEEEADPYANMSASECLIGTWLADNELFLSHMQEFGDEIQTIEGQVLVTLAEDGSMTTDYQDWEMTGSAEGMTVTVNRTGVDTGVFSATDSMVTLEDREMGATIRMSGSGIDMTVPAEPHIQADIPYTCSATEVVMEANEGTHRMVRQ